jgi:hypothetical protein
MNRNRRFVGDKRKVNREIDDGQICEIRRHIRFGNGHDGTGTGNIWFHQRGQMVEQKAQPQQSL